MRLGDSPLYPCGSIRSCIVLCTEPATLLMVSVLLRPRQVLTLGSLLTGTRPCYASYFIDKRMAFSVVERGCQNAKDYRVYFSKQQRVIEKASLAQSLCHMCCWYIATLNCTTVLICVGSSQINQHVPGTAPVTYPGPSVSGGHLVWEGGANAGRRADGSGYETRTVRRA